MSVEDNDHMNDMVNDDDGMYPQQQPLSFEKVWQMFQETDKKFQETDKKFQETKSQIQETDRIVRHVSKIVGGLGNNIGEVAEDYFFQALEKIPELAGVKIERTSKLRGKIKDLEREYDVVLFGHDTIIVVEVKHRLETKDLVTFCDKSLPVFKQLFPEYAGYKMIGAVAGMTATPEAVQQALEMGLLVFTQSGQNIRLLNPKGFEPKEF